MAVLKIRQSYQAAFPMFVRSEQLQCSTHATKLTLSLLSLMLLLRIILHGNTKVWRSKWFKDVYQVTEIMVDNADVGQMTSRNGPG